MYQKYACTQQDPLPKPTLLAYLNNPGVHEIYSLRIDGSPTGGSFTLRLDGQISQTIYYSTEPIDTIAYIKLGLGSAGKQIAVNGLKPTLFKLSFLDGKHHELKLQSNNLSPSGTITVASLARVYANSSTYNLLAALPNWTIAGFDAKQRNACVYTTRNTDWLRRTDGSLQRNPLYLSIDLPPAY